MAQTVFFNLMVDSGTAADPLKAKHGIVGGAVLSGDLSVSWDPTKITTLNQAKSIADFVYQRIGPGAGLK